MNQTARVLSVYGSFLRGAGQHITFYECVADAVAQGCGADEIKALVQAARDGERDKVLGILEAIEDV